MANGFPERLLPLALPQGHNISCFTVTWATMDGLSFKSWVIWEAKLTSFPSLHFSDFLQVCMFQMFLGWWYFFPCELSVLGPYIYYGLNGFSEALYTMRILTLYPLSLFCTLFQSTYKSSFGCPQIVLPKELLRLSFSLKATQIWLQFFKQVVNKWSLSPMTSWSAGQGAVLLFACTYGVLQSLWVLFEMHEWFQGWFHTYSLVSTIHTPTHPTMSCLQKMSESVLGSI